MEQIEAMNNFRITVQLTVVLLSVFVGGVKWLLYFFENIIGSQDKGM